MSCRAHDASAHCRKHCVHATRHTRIRWPVMTAGVNRRARVRTASHPDAFWRHAYYHSVQAKRSCGLVGKQSKARAMPARCSYENCELAENAHAQPQTWVVISDTLAKIHRGEIFYPTRCHRRPRSYTVFYAMVPYSCPTMCCAADKHHHTPIEHAAASLLLQPHPAMASKQQQKCRNARQQQRMTMMMRSRCC